MPATTVAAFLAPHGSIGPPRGRSHACYVPASVGEILGRVPEATVRPASIDDQQ